MFELLSITLKESIILFDIKYYGQVDGEGGGGTMGFLLCPTLANISMCHHETIWLKSCPKKIKL